VVLEDVIDALAAAVSSSATRAMPMSQSGRCLGPEGLDGEERGDHVLLVVLDAAPEDPALFDQALNGLPLQRDTSPAGQRPCGS